MQKAKGSKSLCLGFASHKGNGSFNMCTYV